jgi:hypothetical protein
MATHRPNASPIAATSNRPRRVSFAPTSTDAMSGRSRMAAANCPSATSSTFAPLAARLCRSTSAGPDSAEASSRVQPRHVPSGIGSPMPTVVESPSAAKRIRGGAPVGSGADASVTSVIDTRSH